tara:strand:+ start:761 stop:1423 length:663 start_codon:yes stop_codon:yes gene_type:complete
LIRLVLATSIDGRIAPEIGGKTQLGGKGDRKVLEEALSWADATLIGAKTLRAHQNVCLIKTTSLIKTRTHKGQPEQPISIIVGNGKVYSSDWMFFQQPLSRWLLTNNENLKKLETEESYEKILLLSNNWKDSLLRLNALGIYRIALLGGGLLASSILNEDLIDELQITITPRILGGDKTWVRNQNNNLPKSFSQKNAWVLNDYQQLIDNEIMLRYKRKRD